MSFTDDQPGPPRAGERLTIGEFAHRALLSPKALRLYDRQGLLVPATVDPQSGYRYYTEQQLPTARLIARLRQLDMPLAIVQALVSLPADRQADLLAGWWDDLEARFDARRELMTWLLISLSGRGIPEDWYQVAERDVPEQTVICEQRHITAHELPGWLDERISYLVGMAHQCGGPAGRVFVVYHGEVSEDSNGPVEICVPIDPAEAGRVAIPVRTEPAHREAFAVLHKRQVAYPQILTGYDAVDQWIAANRREIAGPPREIYAPTYDIAGPDDLVCDIAFPIAVS